jgi:hypothetical protein
MSSPTNSTSARGQVWLQDNQAHADQDHDTEDNIAWTASNWLGVCCVIRWRAGGQREADQRQRIEQWNPNKGN